MLPDTVSEPKQHPTKCAAVQPASSQLAERVWPVFFVNVYATPSVWTKLTRARMTADGKTAARTSPPPMSAAVLVLFVPVLLALAALMSAAIVAAPLTMELELEKGNLKVGKSLGMAPITLTPCAFRAPS